MAKTGRPKLLQKDGHHKHDGYTRWHSVDQAHHPDLHDYLHKSNESEESEIITPVMESGPAIEIYNLILDLEKMEYGNSLLFELQNSIHAILAAKKRQEAKRPTQEIKNEQSAIGGPDAEDREPNTYGLP
jgi:hypothetical protein